ncbi:unknown [Clostridium sp. CAG:448]|nr:unknown [Clostridium sp. CAG:448]
MTEIVARRAFSPLYIGFDIAFFVLLLCCFGKRNT